jgi:hypothetical protein
MAQINFKLFVLQCETSFGTDRLQASVTGLRGIVASKRKDAILGWRHCMKRRFIIRRIMKSNSIRWEGHVARMGDMTNTYEVLSETQRVEITKET